MKPHGQWGHQYSSDERGYFGPERSVFYTINAAGYRGHEFRLAKDPATVRRIVHRHGGRIRAE